MKKSSLFALIGVGIMVLVEFYFIILQLSQPSYIISWITVFFQLLNLIAWVMIGVYFLSKLKGEDVVDSILSGINKEQQSYGRKPYGAQQPYNPYNQQNGQQYGGQQQQQPFGQQQYGQQQPFGGQQQQFGNQQQPFGGQQQQQQYGQQPNFGQKPQQPGSYEPDNATEYVKR